MHLWLIIKYTTITICCLCVLYLSSRLYKLSFINSVCKRNNKLKFIFSFVLVLITFAIIGKVISPVNSVICIIYFTMYWLICDVAFWLIKKIFKKTYNENIKGIMAVCASIFSLGIGWYLAHNVWQTDYNLVTQKNIQDLKIIMFADSHIGTTFSGDGFVKHMETINNHNPDIVIIAGDFVDDSTNREDMIKSCKALGNIKTKYGIYFALGNHDRGYYKSDYRGFSLDDLISELKKNNVTILRDETILVDNIFYIIGRQDASSYSRNNKQRKSMSELIANLDNNKYMIVIDHQPIDTVNQSKSGVDLVLSGHTHGGQLFPFNKVGEWIGANDITYGHKNINKTDFVVTSGISDWEIKFKTGTKSEYVVINVGNK